MTSSRPPTWHELQSDTAPWAERLQFQYFREAPAWEKLEAAGELTRWALALAQAELERLHPTETPAQIRRRMADKLLGQELAARFYGPLPSEGAEHDTAA